MSRKGNPSEALAQVSLFSSCNLKELRRIANVADEVTVDAGREIIRQGDRAYECYAIVKGEATVRRNNRAVAVLSPGDAFGELSLFDSGPRTATVRADTDMTLLVIREQEFRVLLEDVPAITAKLLRRLAEELRKTDKRMYG